MFNQKLEETLIRLVKQNNVLYDHNHAKYMDFNAREVAWQKIGDELRRPASDCKVRWIHIRDVYRRILKKSLSSTGKKVKSYKFANELAFLKPFYRDVVTQNDDFEFDDDCIGNDDNQVEDQGTLECITASEESDRPQPIEKMKVKKLKTRSKKKRRKVESNPPPTSTSFDNITPSELDPSDPVDTFLMSIRATLKTFTPYHLNLAKSKIFAMVQEHELQQIVQQQQHEASSDDFKVSTSDHNHLYPNNIKLVKVKSL